MQEENSMCDDRSEVILKNQYAYMTERLPERCVLTKGLQRGELLCYSLQEWERFAKWLDGLPEDERSSHIMKRHFFGQAADIEVTKEGDRAKVPIPNGLYEWLGGSDGGKFKCEYVERRPDSWAARWEVKK